MGDKGVWYLDRHFPHCDVASGVMTGFHLQRAAEKDEVRYWFRCCTGSWVTGPTETHYTPWQLGTSAINLGESTQ